MSDATPLLALSFLQPWLWAIVEGHKGFRSGDAFYAIENRKWMPHAARIGQEIALHASAGWDEEGEEFIDERLILDLPPTAPRYVESPPQTQCARSAIIGTARIRGALELTIIEASPRQHALISEEAAAGTREIEGRRRGRIVGGLHHEFVNGILDSPWAFGPWCWVLTDVRKLREPVPCKGALGFWRVPPDIAELVRAQEAV